ncbi:MAG: hypothetical protein II200_01920 [Bacteroidaceae bacterium]|nr:hypothetical protein [Bacteroidaceae bacterium]
MRAVKVLDSTKGHVSNCYVIAYIIAKVCRAASWFAGACRNNGGWHVVNVGGSWEISGWHVVNVGGRKEFGGWHVIRVGGCREFGG